jgi:hypothetical protein
MLKRSSHTLLRRHIHPSLTMSSPPPNPLKRPAPITHESSDSDVHIISDMPSTSTTTTAAGAKPKLAHTTTPPPAKKPKIALVAGGVGSGGQTKLAFGPVGGGTKTKVISNKPSTSTDSGERSSNTTGANIRGPTSSVGESPTCPRHPLRSP